MAEKLQTAYKTILGEHFPSVIEISFRARPTIEPDLSNLSRNLGLPSEILEFTKQNRNAEVARLIYEKVTWTIDGEERGLRYGENPGQEAAFYRLINGNIVLGDVQTIQPGRWLMSDTELLQSGKHPGKTNITDADNALNILRYFMDEPVVAIMKHNNPCGIAIGSSLVDAYTKADRADRVAAFGGTIALNRPVDNETAKEISERYAEVVVAPDYEEGALFFLSQRKNLRIMRVPGMDKLRSFVGTVVPDFKSLMDGGIIIQTSYVPQARTLEDIMKLPLGYHDHKGTMHKVMRKPTEQEYRDMWFGWLVESGITSNSVIYVKDGVSVGLGSGEKDRVGVAERARDKAYSQMRDILCWDLMKISYNQLLLQIEQTNSPETREQKINIDETTRERRGGLEGAIMVSDAFFPFRDGVDVGLREGITAIIQPGGSERDFEVIDAVNEYGATMLFTGQRSFRH